MPHNSPKPRNPTTIRRIDPLPLGPRVRRFILGSGLLFAGVFAALAADTGSRTTPVRPLAKAVARPVNHAPAAKALTVNRIAANLGLKISPTQPANRVTLSDGTRRLELEADSREIRVNGLRVFLGNAVTRRGGELQVSAIDYHTCLVPLLKPSLAQRRPNRPKVIAIDAGHGGVDQGTENRRLGFKEKTFTLDVALRLKSVLEKSDYTVVLTRAQDVTMDKPMRVVLANRAKADLFVSIHFNSLQHDTKTHGTEVFTFAPQFQRSTNSWSPLEPDDTERQLSPGNHFDAWNSLLAHSLHRELLHGLKTYDRGKKIAHLGVLRGLDCPGVLVESGFLSNDEEARKIATPAYRQKIAVALAAGIEAYADQIDALSAGS
jgi:N-acetylmuramoyl-L-alanine amidase